MVELKMPENAVNAVSASASPEATAKICEILDYFYTEQGMIDAWLCCDGVDGKLVEGAYGIMTSDGTGYYEESGKSYTEWRYASSLVNNAFMLTQYSMAQAIVDAATTEELKAFLTERGHDIQKSQFFAKDMDLRARLMQEIPERFPDLIVSSAVVNNVEINDKNAHKGNAIRQLAQHLGLEMSQVLAFGDGSNDITMLQEAGIGVCMENGLDSVKAIADYITDSCDEDGVAKAIYRFCK